PSDLERDDLDAVCAGVSAPSDERRIVIDFDVTGRFRDISRSLVIELHTNQWNAIVVDRPTTAIVNVLRGRRAGDRAIFPGQRYVPPAPSDRIGATDLTRDEARQLWADCMAGLDADAWPRALLSRFAF